MRFRNNPAAVVLFVAGTIAVVGSVLLLLGVSPARVSQREPTVDRIVNHLAYFGPALLVGWVALFFAGPTKALVLFMVACTAIYLISFFGTPGSVLR
jgi:hypothetical protein